MIKKIKFLVLFVGVILGIASCDKSSDDEFVPFDHEGQIPLDLALLDEYFDEHYYNSTTKTVDLITDEETQIALSVQTEGVSLDTISGISVSGVDETYTMFYLKINDGIDVPKGDTDTSIAYGYPTALDSVFVNYTGMLLDGTVFDSNVQHPTWFNLADMITGWIYGLQKFKGGKKTLLLDGADFEFEDYGEGYLFIPSGLAYRNATQNDIPSSSPLIFKIELHLVNLTDADLDGVPSKYEITVESNGAVSFNDTDGDGVSDHLDADDDNDRILTKDELNDSDNNGVKDYLEVN